MIMWKTSAVIIGVLLGTVCGLPELRVVNGTDSDIKKFNFMVSLRAADGSHMCAGTILTPEWILTAAHCVFNRRPSTLSFQYASTTINETAKNIIYAHYFIVHYKWRPFEDLDHDIALVKLNGRFVFNYDTLGPVRLPEKGFEISQSAHGVPGTLVGWGLNKSNGVLMKTLQEVDQKIYSDAECRARHRNHTTSHMICGGVDEGGKGQCGGDSGGPLLYGANIQLGIASWSVHPCATGPYPGVYTKVSHYISWIKTWVRNL